MQYTEHDIYYKVGEIVYIITKSLNPFMPQIVECEVSGVTVPEYRSKLRHGTLEEKEILPLYHLVSTGDDKGYEKYQTNLRYKSGHKKVFSSRENAQKALNSYEEPFFERRIPTKIELINPGEKISLDMSNWSVSHYPRWTFCVTKVSIDCTYMVDYELCAVLPICDELELSDSERHSFLKKWHRIHLDAEQLRGVMI